MKTSNIFKNIIFYCLFVLSSYQSHAQVFDSLSINVEGGAVFSDYTINRRGTAGKYFNINTEFPITGNIAFTTGVAATNYGSQFNFVFPTDENNAPIRSTPQGFNVTAYDFHYLAFPLRVKFYHRHFYAQLGIKPEFFLYQLPEDMGLLYDEAYFNKPTHPVETVRTKNLSMDAGIGFIYYPKNSPFRYYLETGASHFLKPIYTDGNASENQVSFILKLGLRWVVGKTN